MTESSSQFENQEHGDGSISDLPVGGMFVAIGHTPNTAFLDGAVEMNSEGYIQWTKAFRTNTSVRRRVRSR